MAQPGSILGQITEEFEQLGKQIVRETVKAPKDIAGKALESLGSSSAKPGQTTASAKSDQETAIDKFTKESDAAVKKAIARAALEELAGRKPKEKEPSVRERIEMEEKQKKEMLAKQQAQAQKMQLSQSRSKRPRGDLFGVKAKQSSAERKNVRQD